jgi:hypothetical protein
VAWPCVLLTGAAIACVGAERFSEVSATNRALPAIAIGQFERGRDLTQKYCSTCHLFPEPALLTKTAWIHHIQPEMAKWLGLERVDYEGMQDGRILREAKLYPPSPLVSEDDWFAIWDYYRQGAPSQPLSQVAKAKPQPGLKQFRARKLNPAQARP